MTANDQAQPSAPPTQLKSGALGVTGITFMVVAAAAPLTVLAGVAPLAISIGGIGAPAGYLIAGVVLVIFAVGFTAMTRHTRGAGAFYAYITLGLGRTLGAAAGMLAVTSYNAMQIGVYGLLGAQFAAAYKRFTGHTVPWWLFAGVGIALVWALGRRGIDVGAKVLGVLLTAETLILVLLAASVLVQGGKGGLSAGTFSPNALTHPGMLAILGFCFAAFMGFESTALYRAETRRPDRTIPRATFGAVAFLALFYCLVAWAVVQAFGDAKVVAAATADPAGLFFAAMDTYVGDWASDLMHMLVLTSVLASQLAFHNAINRYAFSLAHDGLLPRALGRSHPRFQSPANAGAVQSVLAAVIVTAFAIGGADPYRQFLLIVNTPGALGVLALQTLTSAAVLAYFLRHRSLHEGVATTCAALAMALLSLALWFIVANVGLLSGAGTTTNAFLVGLVPAMLIGGAGWALYLKRHHPEIHALIGGEDVRRAEAAPAPALAPPPVLASGEPPAPAAEGEDPASPADPAP